MKRVFLLMTLFSTLISASCNKQDSKPSSIANQSTTQGGNTAAKGFWSGLWGGIKKMLGFGSAVHVSYRTGYYESTGPGENQFKCNPGDAVCECTITAGMVAPTQQPNGFGEGMIGLNSDSKLIMAIPRISLSDETYSNHYADGILSVPGPWRLQKELREELDLPENYTIPQGDYAVNKIEVDGEEILVINFN